MLTIFDPCCQAPCLTSACNSLVASFDSKRAYKQWTNTRFTLTAYLALVLAGNGGAILVKEPKPSDALDDAEEEMVPVGFRDITTTMDVYAKDRKVQGAGARALESALDVGGVSLKALTRDGMLRSVTLAHQRFPESRSVALALCRIIGKVTLREPDLVSPEVGIAVLSAGASLPRDAEVVVASLEAVYVLAPKLRNLWSAATNQAGV